MHPWKNCGWRNSRVHGGHIIYRDKTRLWVILGANTLVNITEVSTAYDTYYRLGKSKLSLFSRAGIATLAEFSLGNITIRIIILIWSSRKSLRAVLKFSTGLFPARHQRGGSCRSRGCNYSILSVVIQRVSPDMLQESKPSYEIDRRKGMIPFWRINSNCCRIKLKCIFYLRPYVYRREVKFLI